MNKFDKTQQIIESGMCEQTTGCAGAGDFREWAKQQGYPRCEVLDWTSSAGDWCFIVSQDGSLWEFMTQNNNYPRSGFTRRINPNLYFKGTKDEALEFFGNII